MTREEAIEVLKDIYNYTRFDTYTTNEARTMAIKALEQEPSITPKREQGKWIEEKYGYRCNKCNHFYEGEWSIKNNAMIPHKYCPNCGAKMESEDT